MDLAQISFAYRANVGPICCGYVGPILCVLTFDINPTSSQPWYNVCYIGPKFAQYICDTGNTLVQCHIWHLRNTGPKSQLLGQYLSNSIIANGLFSLVPWYNYIMYRCMASDILVTVLYFTKRFRNIATLHKTLSFVPPIMKNDTSLFNV